MDAFRVPIPNVSSVAESAAALHPILALTEGGSP